MGTPLSDMWFAMAGAFVAVVSCAVVPRWFVLVLQLFVYNANQPPKEPLRRRLWLAPLMLLHPAAWLLAAIVYFTCMTLTGQMSLRWAWGAGGFYLTLVMLGIAILSAMRKARRSRTAPNKSLERTREG